MYIAMICALIFGRNLFVNGYSVMDRHLASETVNGGEYEYLIYHQHKNSERTILTFFDIGSGLLIIVYGYLIFLKPRNRDKNKD